MARTKPRPTKSPVGKGTPQKAKKTILKSGAGTSAAAAKSPAARGKAKETPDRKKR